MIPAEILGIVLPVCDYPVASHDLRGCGTFLKTHCVIRMPRLTHVKGTVISYGTNVSLQRVNASAQY